MISALFDEVLARFLFCIELIIVFLKALDGCEALHLVAACLLLEIPVPAVGPSQEGLLGSDSDALKVSNLGNTFQLLRIQRLPFQLIASVHE